MHKPLALLAVILTTGCAGLLPSTPNASLSLTTVSRPEKAKARYGPELLSTVQDSGKTKYVFEDSLVKVLLTPTRTGFGFRIDNKTSHTIKVMWDEAAIVGPSGASQRLMHTGVKYIDRNNSQPPSVVVARGYLYDEVNPTENVAMAYTSWYTTSLLPLKPYTSATRDAVLADMERQYKGKTVQLLLPLQIEDVTNDYLFTFTVDDITAVLRGVAEPLGE